MTRAPCNPWILVALALAACGKDEPAEGAKTALKELKRAIEAEIDERGRDQGDARSLSVGEDVTVGAAKAAFTRVVQQPEPGSDDPEESLFLHYEITNVSETTVLEAGRRGRLIELGTVRDEFGNEVPTVHRLGGSPPTKLAPGERFGSFVQTRLPPVGKAGRFALEGCSFVVDNEGTTQPLRLVFGRDRIEQAKVPDLSGHWTGTHASQMSGPDATFVMEVTQADGSLEAVLFTQLRTRSGTGWSRERLEGQVTKSGVVDFGAWGKGPLRNDGVSGHSSGLGGFRMQRATKDHLLVTEVGRVRAQYDALDLSGSWELYVPDWGHWAVEIELKQQGDALTGQAVGSDGHRERVPLRVQAKLSLQTIDLKLSDEGGDEKLDVKGWVRAAAGQPPRFELREGPYGWSLTPARARKVPFWKARWNHEEACRLRLNRKPAEALALLAPAYADCRGQMLGWWIGLTIVECHADAGQMDQAIAWVRTSLDDYWPAMTAAAQSSFLKELRESMDWSRLRQDAWTAARVDALARDYETKVGKPLPPADPADAARAASRKATLVSWLKGGKEYDGKRIRKDQAEPFTIQFDLDERTGAVTGLMTWPGLGSRHRIRGGIVEGSTACRVVFEETEAVTHGRADLGTRYGLAPADDGNLGGRYIRVATVFDKDEGTVVVSGPGRDAPVRPTVAEIGNGWQMLTWRLTARPEDWALAGADTLSVAEVGGGIAFSGAFPAGPPGRLQWTALTYPSAAPLAAGRFQHLYVQGALPERCPVGFGIGVVQDVGGKLRRLEIRRNPASGHAEVRLLGGQQEAFRQAKGETFVELNRVAWEGGQFVVDLSVDGEGVVRLGLNGVNVLEKQFGVPHERCELFTRGRASQPVTLMIWVDGDPGARIPEGIRIRQVTVTRAK